MGDASSCRAQVAVSRCADSLPLHRQAKAYRRAGVQMNDSTLGDLFHRTAELTKPLSDRLLHLVAEKEIVLADETTHRVQEKEKTRTAWLWSFIARDEAEKELIAYVFSRSRSGETPVRVLSDTIGKLLVDGYSGYNKVTSPGGRERAGCLAHLRRKFFDAQSASPDAAKRAMDFILDVYRIERAALDADLLGTPEHLAMRQNRSRAVQLRCHVGHSFTGEVFSSEQRRNTESALWTAARIMEERVTFSRLLAARKREQNMFEEAEVYEKDARSVDGDVTRVRDLIVLGAGLPSSSSGDLE